MCLSGVVKTGGYREESACLNVTSHFNISFYSFYFNVLHVSMGGSTREDCLFALPVSCVQSQPRLSQIWALLLYGLDLHLIYLLHKKPQRVSSLFSTRRLLFAVCQVKSGGGSLPAPLSNCRCSSEYVEQRASVST